MTLGYIYACGFATLYESDITNGANQSPSLNGFIGTNLFRSEKLNESSPSSYVKSMTVVKNGALQHLER